MDKQALEKIEDIVARSRNPVPFEAEGYKAMVVLPDGLNLHELDRFLKRPERLKRKIETHDVETLNVYWDKWGTEEAEIFADIDKTQIRMVFDEHEALMTTPEVEEGEAPRQSVKVPWTQWLDHNAVYNCRKSQEWVAWENNDRERMTQEMFGDFLEDRAKDIRDPDSVNLMALTQHFHVGQDINYSKAVRQSDGNVAFAYSQTNEASGSIEIPELFTLGIAPFHNGVVYELSARFRYRINNGALSMWYELIEPHRVVEHAFNEVCKKISEHTGRFIAMVDVDSL